MLITRTTAQTSRSFTYHFTGAARVSWLPLPKAGNRLLKPVARIMGPVDSNPVEAAVQLFIVAGLSRVRPQ